MYSIGSSSNSQSNILRSLGQVCVSHPLEVISFWSFCLLSSLIQWFAREPYYWYSHPSTSLILLLAAAKCLAASLLMVRIRHLAKLDAIRSGISAPLRWMLPFCITVTMVTSATLAPSLHLLNAAVPFFLLLADLQQMALISRVAMTTGQGCVSEGIVHCGPDLLLDMLAKGLAVGVAAVCGDALIESVARLVCLQLALYSAILFTLFPALLHLNSAPEFTIGLTSQTSTGVKNKLLKPFDNSDVSDLETNPAQRNVKVVMTVGLCLVHLTNWLSGSLFKLPVSTSAESPYVHSSQSRTSSLLHYMDNLFLVVYLITVWIVWRWLTKPSTPTPTPSNLSVPQQKRRQEAKETKTSVPKGTEQKKPPSPQLIKTARSCDPSSPSRPTVLSIPGNIESHCVTEGWCQTGGEQGYVVSKRRRTHSSSMSGGSSLQECIMAVGEGRGYSLSDIQLHHLLTIGKLKPRQLETVVQDFMRAVRLRREHLCAQLDTPHALDKLPFEHYDYKAVFGQCCEEVIGYVPLPVGKVGPLVLDGKQHWVPLATTEGTLVASTNRGCRAIEMSGGVTSVVYGNKMTRAPVVNFPSVVYMVRCKEWLETDAGFQIMKEAFESTSAHSELLSIFAAPVGTYLHIRFAASTGEAMGMNMVSKGSEKAMDVLQRVFPEMQVISLSGNLCTDKKASAVNWLLGRGKSVVVECRLTAECLTSLLHVTAEDMARLCIAKNWGGSSLAGAGTGGCNAHAANLVAAVFAATGQDIAQVVDSSACLTQMTAEAGTGSLHITCTLPCMEVGTVGGGTRLAPQRALLDLADLCVEAPAEHLARLVAACVMAGEISLTAALVSHQLVGAHMRFNRATAGPSASAPLNQHCPM